MNLMMNPSFTAEIAAQRRQALIVAADRHRTRRWFKSSKSTGTVSPTSNGGLRMPLAASTTTTTTGAGGMTSPATITREPVTASKELDHACACAA